MAKLLRRAYTNRVSPIGPSIRYVNSTYSVFGSKIASHSELNIKEDLGKHTPYGSTGSSLYSLATKHCFDVINNATPFVLDCIEKIISDRNKYKIGDCTPFTIGDFGTADGGTSIELMHKIITLIRSDVNHKYTPIQILYEDQPENDWISLFNNIQNRNNNKINIDLNKYYMDEFENIYVLCCGNSFYKQCYMNNSIDFIFSSTAMHWLSSIPCKIPNALHSALLSDNDNIKQKYKEQSAKDWNLILLNRSRELKEYGKMVIVNLCIDEYGQYLGNTFKNKINNRTPINMHQLFCELWDKLRTEKVINDDEFIDTNFINNYRTLDEISNFNKKEIPLNLVNLKSMTVKCPFNQKLIDENSDNINGDEYSKLYLPTLRTWSNSTFMNGLSNKRSKKEKELIVNQFFDYYAKDVAADPLIHGMDHVGAYATFYRKSI